MPLKTHRAPALALAPAQHDALQLEWNHRLLDPLAHGLSLLSVSVRGGTDDAWWRLVDDLQFASSDDLSDAGGFQLVSADRTANGGQLGIGVYVSRLDIALLEMQLGFAVARANELDALAA